MKDLIFHSARLQIRRATNSDAEAVLALVPRLLAFGPPAWRDHSEMARADLAVIGDALKSQTDDPAVYVAERGGEVLGFIHLHSMTDYYRNRLHGHVADIAVAASAEGQGIGRHLLEAAESWARRASYDWLSISVFESNARALSVYEEAGFNRDIIRLIKPLHEPSFSETNDLPREITRVHETSAETVSVESTSRAIRVVPFGRDGRGVEAIRPIRAGELIERSPVILVPEHDRVAVDSSNVGSYIFMWEHGKTGEDLYSQKGRAAVVLGFTSLVNHSADPNCTIVRYIEALAIDLIALRDIAAGEEFRIDYHMTLWFTPL